MMVILILALITGLSGTEAAKRKKGEAVYSLHFQGAFEDCENFVNDNMDMSGLKVSYDSTFSYLNGLLIIKTGIPEGSEMSLMVYKDTEIGREFVYTVKTHFCNEIDEPNTPWYSFFNSLNVTSCPIAAKTYPVEKMQFSLEYAKNVMNYEFVGDYYSNIILKTPGQGLDLVPKDYSCYSIRTSLIETKAE